MQADLLDPRQSARVAETLVALGAVRVATGQPFVYTSGWASPVYIDGRLLMSEVGQRRELMDLAAASLAPLVARAGINAIVGAESSGIPLAAWLAERLALPMLYLRKRPVGWGSSAQLEGRLPEDATVLYVDDVTTDARSKIRAAQSLRATGANITECMVLVDYAIYPHSAALLGEQSLNIHALTRWAHLHEALLASGQLDAARIETLASFRENPVQWSIEHGGVGA